MALIVSAWKLDWDCALFPPCESALVLVEGALSHRDDYDGPADAGLTQCAYSWSCTPGIMFPGQTLERGSTTPRRGNPRQ